MNFIHVIELVKWMNNFDVNVSLYTLCDVSISIEGFHYRKTDTTHQQQRQRNNNNNGEQRSAWKNTIDDGDTHPSCPLHWSHTQRYCLRSHVCWWCVTVLREIFYFRPFMTLTFYMQVSFKFSPIFGGLTA